ncbi:hypothetical protein [Streptomyces sp. NBC_01304]|uniref:hypothetical protein n=1 Tax=Streptomyces sp. NBC_01304 TaxID=2903818 RepID=UPI002E0D8C38|nr:hypothetical protein OG430_48680 [Streptomyces sp. NBC_01304]
MTNVPDYTPSPICPHRHCAFLHSVHLVVMAPVVIVACLFGGLATALLYGLLSVISTGLLMLSVPDAFAMTPRSAQGETPLTVRPGWAALALATDFVQLLGMLALVVLFATDQSLIAVPPPSVGGFTTLGVIVAVMVLHRFAHHRAVAPAPQPALAA